MPQHLHRHLGLLPRWHCRHEHRLWWHCTTRRCQGDHRIWRGDPHCWSQLQQGHVYRHGRKSIARIYTVLPANDTCRNILARTQPLVTALPPRSSPTATPPTPSVVVAAAMGRPTSPTPNMMPKPLALSRARSLTPRSKRSSTCGATRRDNRR